jgi:hypothetical protein
MFKEFLVPGSKQYVINILERYFLCLISIFIPGAFYNMREASNMEGHYPEEWSDIRYAQQRMMGLGKAIDSLHSPSSTLVVYMSCSAALALKRVQKRGRPFEATGLSLDYMQTLVDYHEKCFKGCGDDRVMSVSELGLERVLAVSALDYAANIDADKDAIGRNIEPLVNTVMEACNCYFE